MSVLSVSNRLESITNVEIDSLSPSVRTLLTKDLPELIKVAEAAHKLTCMAHTNPAQLVDELIFALRMV